MLWEAPLREAVEIALREETGGEPRIEAFRRLGGGCIGDAREIRLADGRRFFLKLADGAPPHLFERELEGLVTLRSVGGGLRVPRPIFQGETGEHSFLILEFMDPAAERAPDFSERLGRGLAALHGARSEHFGFGADNYIGLTLQQNEPSADWIDFFRTRRLAFQLELVRRKGLSNHEIERNGARLLDRLDVLIGPRAIRPSLVHGDLWSGNVMHDETGAPVLIDPAVHFADSDVDLAMLELFDRSDPRVFAAYREIRPIDDGYEVRRDIYNLYHLLNHLNLFGGGYLASVATILRRYAA